MLQASDLTKSHDGAPLFDGLSLVLDDGERAGLVGVNGVGKTTLLRLLAGVDRPDRGAVARRRGRARRLAAAGACPTPGATIDDLLGAGARRGVGRCARELDALEARWRGDRATSSATGARRRASRRSAAGRWRRRSTRRAGALGIEHLDPDAPLARLSGGERRARCWPARCSASRPCCCSTSRPTTSTSTACAWLEEWLRGFAGTVARRLPRPRLPRRRRRLHPRARARRCADALRGRLQRSSRRARAPAGEARARLRGAGEATTTPGGRHRDDAPPGAAHRAHREPRGGAEAQALRQEGGARRPRRARGGCGASSRATRAVTLPAERPAAAAAPGGPRARAPARRRAARRALARAARRRPHAASRRPRRGHRPQRRGQDDAARRALRRARARGGRRSSCAGAVRVLPQTPVALPADERVVDWLRAQAALDEGAARTLLGAFALDTAAVHRPLGRLSPGERARVHMAAMVASGAELLLLDEPTNHLDPETLEAVEAALRAFRGHDRRGLPRPRLPRGARRDAAARGPRRRGARGAA